MGRAGGRRGREGRGGEGSVGAAGRRSISRVVGSAGRISFARRGMRRCARASARAVSGTSAPRFARRTSTSARWLSNADVIARAPPGRRAVSGRETLCERRASRGVFVGRRAGRQATDRRGIGAVARVRFFRARRGDARTNLRQACRSANPVFDRQGRSGGGCLPPRIRSTRAPLRAARAFAPGSPPCPRFRRRRSMICSRGWTTRATSRVRPRARSPGSFRPRERPLLRPRTPRRLDRLFRDRPDPIGRANPRASRLRRVGRVPSLASRLAPPSSASSPP